MRRDDIKSIVGALGRGFIPVFADLLEGRDQQGRQVPKLLATQVSIRALWEALVGPVDETLDVRGAAGRFGYIDSAIVYQEAIDSTMFPQATGVLVASQIMAAYDMPNMIGDSLVTVMRSKLKSERIVGFSSMEGPLEVPEGMPYQESTFGEKFVTTETSKKGRIIELTAETVLFDQTGQILLRASRLGELTREEREKTILAGVVDVGSGVAGYKDVYRPGGVATPLFSAGNQSLLATATPLVDWTDIDEALRYHAENARDDRANAAEALPIMLMPRVILTARRHFGTIARIINATEVSSAPGSADISSITTAGNPMGNIAPGLQPLASPLLDYLAALPGSRYNDAADWFIGDPKKQFIWQEIWPLRTERARQDDDANFRRDIVARYKASEYGGIAALDSKWWVKVKAV